MDFIKIRQKIKGKAYWIDNGDLVLARDDFYAIIDEMESECCGQCVYYEAKEEYYGDCENLTIGVVFDFCCKNFERICNG